MEAEESQCGLATNWTVAGGSLDASVTFESSSSPIDVASAAPKPPSLLLRPPLPDPSPCEIKICFRNKHKIRQVYVRSSARVYEIYYAPDAQSWDEYLCTVRCSMASEEEQLFNPVDNDENVSEHINGLNKQAIEVKPRNDNYSSNNEDDWVEVKVSDSPPLAEGNSCPQSETDMNTKRDMQALYEATAEINDADPCISLTLRLLSIQNRECVYVGEIYIFADPMESINLESQRGSLENSARSSLMTMLVPALVQLPKKVNCQKQGGHISDTRDNQNSKEVASEAIDLSKGMGTFQQGGNPTINGQQEVVFKQEGAVTAKLSQLQTLREALSRDEKRFCTAKENNLPHGQFESSLDQLASRLARIENLCLRFEESMLKPINGIEARLQRVEQQIEALNKKSHSSAFPSCSEFSASRSTGNGNDCLSSGAVDSYQLQKVDQKLEALNTETQHSDLPSCSRFAAPEFTCNDSDSCSFYNCEIGQSASGAVELIKGEEKKLEAFDKATQSSELTSCSRFFAPEFTCNGSDSGSFYNDGGDYFTCGAVESEDQAYEKLSIPIDDMSLSVSKEADELYTPQNASHHLGLLPSLVVTAPDFSGADDDKENDALELAIDSPKTEPKQSLSIDNALASALAGFMISTRSQTSTKMPAASASVSCASEDGIDNGTGLQKAQSEVPIDAVILHSKASKAEGIRPSTASNISSLDGDTESSGLDEEVDKPNLCNEGGQDKVAEHIGAEHEEASAEKGQITEKTHLSEAISQTKSGSDSGEIHLPSPAFHYPSNEANVQPCGTCKKADTAAAAKVTEQGCNKNILEDILNMSNPLLTVNFENPILDVKFISQEISYSEYSLEGLLADTQRFAADAHGVEEKGNGAAISKQSKSIPLVDLEEKDSTTNCRFVYLDDDDERNLELENGFLQDNCLCSGSPETFLLGLSDELHLHE